MKLKVLIVGVGQAGRHLASQIAATPDAAVVAAVDIDAEARANFQQQFKGHFDAPAFADIASAVAAARPNVAVVASSNDAHAANVTNLIECGVQNIFCEKPLALDLDDARRVVALSERHGIRTGMGFLTRHPGLIRIHDAVAAGKLGDLLTAYVHCFRGYGFWGHERPNGNGLRQHHSAVRDPQHSGGWTVHHACHGVFTLTSLAGLPTAVHGSLARSADPCPSEEVVCASLQFPRGATGLLIDSVGGYRGLHVGVIGSRGTMMFNDSYQKIRGQSFDLVTRYEGASEQTVERVRHCDADPDQLACFLEAVRHGQPSTTPFRAGLDNLMICQAIVRSSESGGVTPVHFDRPVAAEPAAAFAIPIVSARPRPLPTGSVNGPC